MWAAGKAVTETKEKRKQQEKEARARGGGTGGDSHEKRVAEARRRLLKRQRGKEEHKHETAEAKAKRKRAAQKKADAQSSDQRILGFIGLPEDDEEAVEWIRERVPAGPTATLAAQLVEAGARACSVERGLPAPRSGVTELDLLITAFEDGALGPIFHAYFEFEHGHGEDPSKALCRWCGEHGHLGRRCPRRCDRGSKPAPGYDWYPDIRI